MGNGCCSHMRSPSYDSPTAALATTTAHYLFRQPKVLADEMKICARVVANTLASEIYDGQRLHQQQQPPIMCFVSPNLLCSEHKRERCDQPCNQHQQQQLHKAQQQQQHQQQTVIATTTATTATTPTITTTTVNNNNNNNNNNNTNNNNNNTNNNNNKCHPFILQSYYYNHYI
jgi:hypothetical protein